MGAMNRPRPVSWLRATSLLALAGDAHQEAQRLNRAERGHSLDDSPGIGSRLQGGRYPAGGPADLHRALAPARGNRAPKNTCSCAVKARTRTSSGFLLLSAFVMRECPLRSPAATPKRACARFRAYLPGGMGARLSFPPTRGLS
jgi:hypothetical protein